MQLNARIAPIDRPQGAAAFARTAAATMGRLLGASKAVFVERRASRPRRADPDDVHFVHWPAWCKEHYCRHVRHQDPIGRWLDSPQALDGGGVVCLSDLIPMPALLQTPYFDAMLRPTGARFVLSVALLDGESVSGVLSLVRDAGGRDFDAADRELARTLAPLLGAAWRGAAIAAPAGLGLSVMPSMTEPAQAEHRLAGLTPREHDIVRLVVTGRANKDIALLLGLSPWTVKNHLRAVFEKTGVHKRTALCALALGEGTARG